MDSFGKSYTPTTFVSAILNTRVIHLLALDVLSYKCLFIQPAVFSLSQYLVSWNGIENGKLVCFSSSLAMLVRATLS